MFLWVLLAHHVGYPLYARHCSQPRSYSCDNRSSLSSKHLHPSADRQTTSKSCGDCAVLEVTRGLARAGWEAQGSPTDAVSLEQRPAEAGTEPVPDGSAPGGGNMVGDEQQGRCGWSGASEGQWERRGHGIPVIEACYRPSKDWGWEATWTNKRGVLSRDVMQSDSLQGDHGSRAGNVYGPESQSWVAWWAATVGNAGDG